MKIIKHQNLILLLTCLGILWCLWHIPKMQADYSFESFFPQSEPALAFYQAFKKDFGSDDQLLFIAVQRESSIFDSLFLKKIQQLTTDFRSIKHVVQAQSLVTLTEARKTPFGIVQVPFLSSHRSDYRQDSIRLLKDTRVKNTLLSADAQTLNILLEIEDQRSELANDSLITAIDSLCVVHGINKYHVGGNINTEVHYIRMLEWENIKLISLFTVVVILVLMILYRSFVSILIPTASVLIGLVFLYGYAAAIGRNLNIATLMFPTIMVVVGMSDLVHLYNKYLSVLRTGVSKETAIQEALKEVRKTLFLTSFTTAIGFLSLGFSDVPHVSTFGIDATVGVWLAFLIAITLSPVLILKTGDWGNFLKLNPVPSNEKGTARWRSFFDNIYHITQQHDRKILAISILLLGVAIWGITKIDTNNYLLGNVSEDTRVRQDYLFFEQELSGIRAFELAIEPQNQHQINELVVLKEIEKLETHLATMAVIGPTFSPVTLYKSVHQMEKGGRDIHYQLPKTERTIQQYERYKNRFRYQDYIREDAQRGRLTAKMKDIGRLEVKKLNTQLDVWINENIDTSLVQFQQTGSALLVDKNNEALMKEMVSSLSVAFVIISLIMAYLYRSLWMVFISLVPNIFPLLLTAGMMGWCGIELNGSSSIIFTISFVIAVDDTIHFLSKFKWERDKGLEVQAAIYETLQHTGKSILITSLILAFGYSAAIFSVFREAYYHGVLICFTLCCAVFADLFLLPVFLNWRREKK